MQRGNCHFRVSMVTGCHRIKLCLGITGPPFNNMHRQLQSFFSDTRVLQEDCLHVCYIIRPCNNIFYYHVCTATLLCVLIPGTKWKHIHVLHEGMCGDMIPSLKGWDHSKKEKEKAVNTLMSPRGTQKVFVTTAHIFWATNLDTIAPWMWGLNLCTNASRVKGWGFHQCLWENSR